MRQKGRLAAHGSEHLSQKLSDPTLLEWEVPLAIKHPQDDIPQPRLGDAAAQGLGSLTAAKVDQVEATSATKEGGGGRAGRVQAVLEEVKGEDEV